MLRILTVCVVMGCSSAALREPAGQEPAEAIGSRVEEETPPERSGSQDAVVVARIVASGPVGSGACHQCSHEVTIEQRVSGDLGTSSLWVHYEACDGQRLAQPGTVDPCTLERGSVYELRLRRGASESFGNEPMIVSARPR